MSWLRAVVVSGLEAAVGSGHATPSPAADRGQRTEAASCALFSSASSAAFSSADAFFSLAGGGSGHDAGAAGAGFARAS